MPIVQNDERTCTAVRFGDGDVALCPASETAGEREYVLLQATEPGEVGLADDVGREFPIREGFVPGEAGTCVILEFASVEALDMLIHTLQAHRRQRFEGAANG